MPNEANFINNIDNQLKSCYNVTKAKKTLIYHLMMKQYYKLGLIVIMASIMINL